MPYYIAFNADQSVTIGSAMQPDALLPLFTIRDFTADELDRVSTVLALYTRSHKAHYVIFNQRRYLGEYFTVTAINNLLRAVYHGGEPV